MSLIRNTIGTIKCIIKFFRDSPKRRSLISSVPLLSETRWTAKYKSIRIFAANFSEIYEKLSTIADTEIGKVRQDAHQLVTAASTSNFLISLVIISTYSALLEPVTQALQAVALDLCTVHRHVQDLLVVLRNHRKNPEVFFEDIFSKATDLSTQLDISLNIPRTCGRQAHRSNFKDVTVQKYYQLSVFIPYLDSIISSLECRFSPENEINFHLFLLCPVKMSKMSRQEFKTKVTEINNVYDIDNFESEAMTWYEMWHNKAGFDYKNGFVDLLNHTELYPAIEQAIILALTLPASTCTIERTFSTMRRVKTWLRSTMTDNRLSGLCMMSVHRKYVNENKADFVNEVINKFGATQRRLQFFTRLRRSPRRVIYLAVCVPMFRRSA